MHRLTLSWSFQFRLSLTPPGGDDAVMDDPGGGVPGEEAIALRGPPVLIAEGSESSELERLVEALEAHDIGYQIREGRQGRWRVVIGLADAFRARNAVAEMSRQDEQARSPHPSERPAGMPPVPRPGPLHEISHYNGLRFGLLAVILALAAWLAALA